MLIDSSILTLEHFARMTEFDVVPAGTSLFHFHLNVVMVSFFTKFDRSIVVAAVGGLTNNEVSIRSRRNVQVSLVLRLFKNPFAMILLVFGSQRQFIAVLCMGAIDLQDTSELVLDRDRCILILRDKSPMLLVMIALAVLRDDTSILGFAILNVDAFARMTESNMEKAIASILKLDLGVVLIAALLEESDLPILIVV